VIQRIGGNDPERMAAVSWSIDLSGGIQRVALQHGCVPFGNGKARAVAWNLPDPIPVHREPIYSPRPIWWPIIPPAMTAGSSACPTSARRSRPRGDQKAMPSASRSS
jgi:hypothetical protein